MLMCAARYCRQCAALPNCKVQAAAAAVLTTTLRSSNMSPSCALGMASACCANIQRATPSGQLSSTSLIVWIRSAWVGKSRTSELFDAHAHHVLQLLQKEPNRPGFGLVQQLAFDLPPQLQQCNCSTYWYMWYTSSSRCMGLPCHATVPVPLVKRGASHSTTTPNVLVSFSLYVAYADRLDTLSMHSLRLSMCIIVFSRPLGKAHAQGGQI